MSRFYHRPPERFADKQPCESETPVALVSVLLTPGKLRSKYLPLLSAGNSVTLQTQPQKDFFDVFLTPTILNSGELVNEYVWKGENKTLHITYHRKVGWEQIPSITSAGNGRPNTTCWHFSTTELKQQLTYEKKPLSPS